MCFWEENKDKVLGEAEIWKIKSLEHQEKNTKPQPNEIRKKCYRICSSEMNGYLGKGVRKELPSCVVTKIRETYPNEDEKKGYMGYKDE